ncbi:MAG: Gfo/Idh/MocA family oxidoreductase [Bacteroidales bacterium]
MNKKGQIRVAVASYGMSGQLFHCPFFDVSEHFSLDVILERTQNRSSQKYPNAIIARTYDEILSNPDIDLIVVNTPDHLHFTMCRDAIKAGKHVVVEKPFTQRLSQAEELITLAKREYKQIFVYQNRRWASDFLTVKSILEQGVLGNIVEYEAHFDRYRPSVKDTWRERATTAYSGALYNLGSHLVDQVVSLWGRPSSVTAFIRKVREGAEANDFFDIKLQYPRLLVTLKSSYLAASMSDKFIISGDKGAFRKKGDDVQEEQLKKGLYPNALEFGIEPKENEGTLYLGHLDGVVKSKRVNSERGCMIAFFDAIASNLKDSVAFPVKYDEVLTVMEILEACITSNERRSTVLM